MIELTTTAIHEAGHAVAFCRLFPEGRIGGMVTIVAGHGNLGAHSSEELVFYGAKQTDVERDMVRKEAIYCCAGFAAAHVAGVANPEAGCGQDFSQAQEIMDLATAQRAAIDLMSLPENIAAVKLVADVLMQRQTIDHDHLAVLVELADGAITEADYLRYLTFVDHATQVSQSPGDT